MRFSSKWFVATAMALLTTGGFVAAFAQSPGQAESDKTESAKPGEKQSIQETFTIELKVEGGGVVRFEASPDASYASVAEMLKGVATTLEKQGKHPQIEVKSSGRGLKWTDWTAQNCKACHQTTPEGAPTTANFIFGVKDTCEPGVASWLERVHVTTPTTTTGAIDFLTLRDQVDYKPNQGAEAAIRYLTVLDLTSDSAPWAAQQAVGPPNTFVYGDQNTAWASKSPDGQGEWLQLTYDAPVDISAVLIHETYNPGAIARVDAILPDNGVVVLWSGEPKATSSDTARLFLCKPNTAVKAAKIRVTIASDVVAGWNEIDAVGILDAEGKVHWAKEAAASSSFADASKDKQEPNAGWQGGLTEDSQLESLGTRYEFHHFGEAVRAFLVEGADPNAAPKASEPQKVQGYRFEAGPSHAEPSAKEATTAAIDLQKATDPAPKLWGRLTQRRGDDSEKLKQIEAELDLLQKQLEALRAKMKASP